MYNHEQLFLNNSHSNSHSLQTWDDNSGLKKVKEITKCTK